SRFGRSAQRGVLPGCLPKKTCLLNGKHPDGEGEKRPSACGNAGRINVGKPVRFTWGRLVFILAGARSRALKHWAICFTKTLLRKGGKIMAHIHTEIDVVANDRRQIKVDTEGIITRLHFVDDSGSRVTLNLV